MLQYDIINAFINILEFLSHKLESQVTIYKEKKKIISTHYFVK